MKYLLAVALVLAGAIFPLALRGQSVAQTSTLSAPGHWEKPEVNFNSGFGYRGFRSASRTVVFPPFWGYPSNYPFAYFYPGLWPPLGVEYRQAYRSAHGDVAAEVAAQRKDDLDSQVQALKDEIQSLREQQAARQGAAHPLSEALQPPTPPQPGAEQKFPVTVFVYRDGREMEVRDYAIFGNTLWVFHRHTSRRFPLADFNLAASRQVNEEHGVEFPASVSQQH